MLSRLVACVAGCALLLVLAPAPGVAVAPAPSPKPDKKDDAKKEEPKKDTDRQPADADLNRVPGHGPAVQPAQPGGFDPAQAYRMQQEMTRQMQQRMGFGTHGAPFFAGYGQVGEGRLGVFAQKPSATLAEQLDLPHGQGVVIERVQPDSPADRAGLKAHDVLLELNGKTVPDDAQALARQVRELKADTPVDAVVLRKGKRETIKGLKLPEASAPAPAFAAFNFAQTAPAMPPMAPLPPNPNFQPGMPPGAAGGVLLTTFRTGDRFTTRYQEGSLVITVTGTVADGKAKLGEIHVQDAGKGEDYSSVDKVPERYRDKVKTLVETSEKSGARIEIKSP
jgi:hypothetical protein